jgi:phospholipid transport system substrate-binding protein
MKKLNYILSVLILMFFSSLALAQPSPVPMLEQTADNIIQQLSKSKSDLTKKVVHSAVKHYLLPNVDVYGMARSVLGRSAWRKASKTERKRFANAFTQLVIRTYANPLTEYTNETVKFLPIRGGYQKRFVTVNSVIIRPTANNIPLSYSLIYKKKRWKIYDMSVEGVSLLQSFRSQFSAELQRGSIDDLIKRLQNHKGLKAS